MRLNAEVVKVLRVGARIEGAVVAANGGLDVIRGTDFLSTMPISELVRKLDPPPVVLAAAERLRYRDFLTVCLIVSRPTALPGQLDLRARPERGRSAGFRIIRTGVSP